MMTAKEALKAVRSSKEVIVWFTLMVNPASGEATAAGYIPVSKKFIIRELKNLSPTDVTSARQIDEDRVVFDDKAYSDINGQALS